MNISERRWKTFIIATWISAILGSTLILGAGWFVIENNNFERQTKQSVTILEPSRYIESGNYAPVDTNGDGKPDDWISGQFDKGQTVSVVDDDGTLSTGPSTAWIVMRLLLIILILSLPLGLGLALFSSAIDRALAARSTRHRLASKQSD